MHNPVQLEGSRAEGKGRRVLDPCSPSPSPLKKKPLCGDAKRVEGEVYCPLSNLIVAMRCWGPWRRCQDQSVVADCRTRPDAQSSSPGEAFGQEKEESTSCPPPPSIPIPAKSTDLPTIIFPLKITSTQVNLAGRNAVGPITVHRCLK